MGALVVGAGKVEEGVERLKTNLRQMTKRTKARTKPMLRRPLVNARRFLRDDTFEPFRRMVQAAQSELSSRAAVALNRTEAKSRIALSRIIERAIDELEKAKRSLGSGSGRISYAS